MYISYGGNVTSIKTRTMKESLGTLLDKQKPVAVKPVVVEAIKVGGYALSVQASDFHYCFPRKILDSYEYYDSFEMKIMKEDLSDIKFKKSSKFRAFPRYKELIARYDGSGIFGWVDKDILEDLIKYLEKKTY